MCSKYYQVCTYSVMNHEIDFIRNYSFERDCNPYWRFANAQESGSITSLQLWISLYFIGIVDYSHYQRNRKVITPHLWSYLSSLAPARAL